MGIEVTTEKRFEEDIEAFFLSAEGGYTKSFDIYNAEAGLYIDTFIGFIKSTQPKEWTRFEKICGSDPVKKFISAFNNACDTDGLLYVLRHGFKHKGIPFRVCYFKPESRLNKLAAALYEKNICNCIRQWHYSAVNKNSIDMVLTVNGIPVIALELKNQYTGQNVENAKNQWMNDREPREICFNFNKRILAYYCVDHTDVYMT
ncbi:MAG: type I restriction endonuclease subunit R, partial [Oscillospiraceae bacterium]|nr:type I restriction endonuclease subunit R [Oscillospiraceae bacterium]